MIKVTNSDLALHAGPVGRGMKNWDADDVMRELGLPILEYQEEPDYDSDLFAILCGIADVGSSKLGLGQATLAKSFIDSRTGERDRGDLFGLHTITREQAEKSLLTAKDLKHNMVLEGLEKAHARAMNAMGNKLELDTLTEAQKRDDAHVDREAIKKPAGSQWDGEKGANALIDAHEAVVSNPEAIALFDALQDAIDAEGELAKSKEASILEKAKAIKSKRELEEELDSKGGLKPTLFKQWKRWRNTSEQKKTDVFQSLDVSEFYSVVQRANETGNVGTSEDALKYDHTEVERFNDRSDDLCESNVLENGQYDKFAGSMLHGQKEIQAQLNQSIGEGHAYKDLARTVQRAKEATRKVHSWN